VRLLAVVDYLNNVGGAELSAATIVRRVAATDDVSVTVVGADLAGTERLDYGAATVVPVSLPARLDDLPDGAADPLVGRLLARACRGRAFDVAHAHHRRGAFALATLDPDVPTVGTVRDFWPVCPISVYTVEGEPCSGCDHRLGDCVAYQGWDGVAEPAVRRYLLAKRRSNRRRFRALDHAVYIAAHLRETVESSLGDPLPDATRIYNPVELPAGVGSGTDDGGSGEPPTDATEDDTPRFVTASSLAPEKGIGTAIRAVGRLADVHPSVRLDVFGDGRLRADLEALAADVAPPDAVAFHGRVPVERVYEAMRDATATVVPSTWAEPFGRVTVEAMLLGSPVVGSDRGGVAEVVRDGETGLLFPPGDDAALAERLRELVERPDRRVALAERARADAGRFSPEAVGEAHVGLYRSLVG